MKKGSFLILLIIMLSDFRSPATKRNIDRVNKSSTAVSLPGITNAMKYCRTDRKVNKQSYLQTINHISENVEYNDKNTVYLTKQQSKLKQMLKKMNSDTLQMIDLIRPKKNIVKTSKEEMTIVADRQLDNSKKNISILQLQIEKLESKYNKIVEQQTQQILLNKIKEIKQDIESLKSGNVDIKLNIDKDGKEIVKEYSEGYDSKLTILENDNNLQDQKLERLKQENNRVIQESSKLKIKLKEVQDKVKSRDQQYQKVKETLLFQTANKNLEITFKERRYQMQTIKKRMEFQNNHCQYKYYKLLKQLEAKKSTCDQLSQRQEDLLKQIAKSKEQMIIYQAQNERLKRQKQEKNRSVLLFLEKQRKNKEDNASLRDSMLSSNLFASRQQLIPHAISLREPAEKNAKRGEEFDQTRQWKKSLNQEKQIISSQENKQKTEVIQGDIVHANKQDIDYSTAQLKQKLTSLQTNKEQIKISDKDNKNPELSDGKPIQ